MNALESVTEGFLQTRIRFKNDIKMGMSRKEMQYDCFDFPTVLGALCLTQLCLLSVCFLCGLFCVFNF